MSPRTFITIVAVLVFAVGLLGLLSTIEVTTDFGRVDCGTAIAPEYRATDCAEARDDRNTWAIPVALVGLVALVGARFVRFGAPNKQKK